MSTMKHTTLITGASSGIGLELARLFAKDGYNLVLVARSEDRLIALKCELAEKYGARITILAENFSARFFGSFCLAKRGDDFKFFFGGKLRI